MIWWMEGAAPRFARLVQLTILPFHSTNLDVPALMSAAGLQKFREASTWFWRRWDHLIHCSWKKLPRFH